MIKINLLAVERPVSKKRVAFPAGQKLTLVCTLILVGAALFVGWRYWSLDKETKRIDAEIATAQSEVARLQTIIAEVQRFEQRSTQLGQRVAIIEQLRRDQTGPVHMLDQISRALPTMLWLTDVKQGTDPNEVLVEGRCTTLTGLSDFVGNLEQSGYFRRSVEIVSSQTEPLTTPPGELIRFSIRAQFQQPAAASAPAEKAAPAAETPRGEIKADGPAPR